MASIDDNGWQQNKSVLQCNKYMFENQIHCDVTFTFKNRDSPGSYVQAGNVYSDVEAENPGNGGIYSSGSVRPNFISAHKYVLMSRSPTFYTKFTDSTRGATCTIKVDDVEKAVFVKMLRFIYFEEIQFTTNNVCELLHCATKCKVDELAVHCRKFMENKVNATNACLFLDRIIGRGEKTLEEKCLNVIESAPNDAFASLHFPNMGKSTLKKILERDTLDVAEIDVFDACLTWAKAKCAVNDLEASDENMRDALGDVIFYIRFPVMGIKEYTNRVATRKLLTAEEALETLLYLTKAKPQCEAPFLSTKRKRAQQEIIFEPIKINFQETNSDTYITFRDHPIRVSAIYFINPSDIKLEEITIGNSKSSQFSEVQGRTVANHRLFQAIFPRAIVLAPGEYAITFSAPVDPHKLYPSLDYDDKMYDDTGKPVLPSYNYGHFLVGFKYKAK